MDYDSIIVGVAITGLAYWYFNVRGKTKCIIMNKKCNETRCVLNKK